VHHSGEHYVVDGLRFLPRPTQRPGVPVWVAGYPGRAKPLRRAARYNGFFPVNLEGPDQLAEIVAELTTLRQLTDGSFDVVAALGPGVDPAPYAAAGATWWLVEFLTDALSVDVVRGVIRDGPTAV
jgi:alkanesulfonate monooxygenase SsuD/methylene tetrahydromethanopterin reductase-like flavin-dependent oxidoreductase (luciferase family)